MITRLLRGLNHYIYGKFNVKATRSLLDGSKERLFALRNSQLDRERYRSLFAEFQEKDTLHITSSQFYEEIDQLIQEQIDSALARNP